MRAFTSAALALMLACGPAFAAPQVGGAGGSVSRSFILDKSFVWPNTSGGSQLPKLTDANLVRLCRVGAAGSSNTTWDCEKPDGTSGITWSGNTGLTTYQTFVEGQYAAWFPANAGAKSTSIPDLETTLNGPYTIIAGFYEANRQAAAWYFQHTGTGTIAVSDQNLGVEYDDGAASITSSSIVRCIGGWCFGAFRSDGSGNTSLSLDGAKQTGTGAHTALASSAHIFGNRTQLDLGMNGYLMFVAYFNTNMSDALVAQYRDNFYGAYNAGGSTGGSTGGGIYNTATGNVEFFTGGLGVSSHHIGGVTGLLCSKGLTDGKNFMAADALDVTSWTLAGTGSVSANVASGPFAAYKNQGAEADQLVDTDAAAFRKASSLEAISAGDGFYTCAFFLAAGTSGTTKTKARITFDTDGTSTVAGCDFTALTSTFTFSQCKTQLTGGTTMKCSINVGTVVADTGSIQIAGGFFNHSPNIEVFRLTNASVGSSNYTLPTSVLSSVTMGGKLVMVHTPLFDPLTQWANSQGTYYMFDATLSNAHDLTFIFGYTVAGRFYAQSSSDTSILTDGIGMTPLLTYATSAEWSPIAGGGCSFKFRHNACDVQGSACSDPTTVVASGTGACPSFTDSIKLCDRYDATVPSSLIYNAVRTYVWR